MWESGEMCAMKEVTLFLDDAKSKESAKQLGQEIALLSRLRYPNIVQYIGMNEDIEGANILVDLNGHIKLADFGMTKHAANKK
ncbi:mitogen-activated protein kinase kinase kinase 5-like isoform X2 [Camellia sinensis]|uniref:mitogen-activated protein kinase kinase kinase 5-like isoform X2 n=1 Tax=Camellia sinensis TaxID=4442 RepID=UPI001036C594|nr:mitogen-activated protein kinase kinase kinase 5-like isoform X2 [Camellia sinensis]